MSQDPIYLDHNATTPIAPEVAEAMAPFLKDGWGNPSSGHVYGRAARAALDQARAQVAALLGAEADEIVFTSGGSESNNLAILGTLFRRELEAGAPTGQVITSSVEHPAVSAPLSFARARGVAVSVAPVDDESRVDVEAVRSARGPDTALITIMHANNETGALNDLPAIVAAAGGARVHTDAAQSVGKVPVDVRALGVDLLTVAGHKLYAPKGVGALYVRRGVELCPILHGAGHEGGRRAGTESALMAVGLGAACALAAAKLDEEAARVQALRDALHDALTSALGDRVVLNGPRDARLPNTLNLSFLGVNGASLLAAAPEIAASTGSACHEGVRSVSPVLAAMGVSAARGEGAVRLSLGRGSDRDAVGRAAEVLTRAYRSLTE